MASTSKQRKKNHELQFAEKVKLIEEKEKNDKTEQKLAEQFNISRSQVHRILHKKDHIMAQKKNKSYMKRVRDKRKCSSHFFVSMRKISLVKQLNTNYHFSFCLCVHS